MQDHSSIMFRLPESNLFSSMHPSGMSIRWPSLATTREHNQFQILEGEVEGQRTDDGAPQGDVTSEVNIAGDGQVVELDDLRDLLESLLELRDLLKVVAQLDDRRRLELASLVDDKLTVLKRVNIGLDEEEVTATLDGEEPRARDVYTVAVPEVLDGRPGGGLELEHRRAIIHALRVDDDLEIHCATLHYALECAQVDPQIVRVEDFELAH